MNVQEILFGWDPMDRIVAVEPQQDTAVVYRRTEFGVTSETRPFTPWLLAPEMHDLRDVEWDRLEGESGYVWLARFPDWQAFTSARYQLRDEHASHLAYPSAVKQYLISSGQTLFKDLSFEQTHRLQLDIETLGYSPDPEENAVFMIALSDNRGLERALIGDESEILCELVDLVQKLDPDTIEGHNIFGFDLPYLAKRAEMRGIPLKLGRDGSPVSFGSERNAAIGGYSRPFLPAFIYGRHVADTMFGVQRFDVGRGALASYGLKEAAADLGLSAQERIIIPKDEIAATWRQDPERVKVYAMQDVFETRALAELVFPSDFYVTQMVPDSFQNVLTSGSGEKINAILLREYVRRKYAIPRSQTPKPVVGGYTEIKAAGVIRGVVKCDVESLYPSVMLSNGIKPTSDRLGIFLPMLKDLTQRRLDAKARAKKATGTEQAYWDGVQNSFKILINSFYGYLGAPLQFNDYDAAEQVTTTGQGIVKGIVAELERTGSLVIEIDTDGVYFSPPEDVKTEEEELAYIEQVGRSLPEGIRLAHDGRYQVMISLKVKNYILVGYDGKKVFKGASTRSRADEKFGRELISRVVDHLVADDKAGAAAVYQELQERIEHRDLPIEMFARRERVTEKTFTSTAKKRSAEAARGAKVGDYISVYDRADGSLGLAEEYANDEDVNHLLEKLYRFACRLREAFGDEFDELFPKPSRRPAGQASLF